MPSTPALIDTHGVPLRTQLLQSSATGAGYGQRSGFMRDDSPGYLFPWRPALREPSDEHREAWTEAAARTIDALHNSGWLAGGVDQAVASICGPSLHLNARPDPDLMGGPKAASEWARRTERRYEAWASNAYECDLFGRHNMGQSVAQATKTYFGPGEVAGVVRFKKRPGNTWGTKIMVVPARRIPMQSAQFRDTDQGIQLDEDGMPVAVVFENPPRLPNIAEVREVLVPVRDEVGRPQVIHIHDSPSTALRGISPLTPALRVIRQFDQLANATLTTALIQAVFAATIESNAPTPDLVTMLQGIDEQATGPNPTAITGDFDRLMAARLAWYMNTKFDLGQVGKILHLFVGEKLNFHTPSAPNSTFKDFVRFLLREIAKCLGITYEQLTGDREGATYSSERMGSAEAWLITLYRRMHISGRLAQISYEAWLEEDIEAGGTEVPGGLPGFLANRTRIARADWRGPPKPTADDLKTAKANEIERKNGVLTREMWCAEKGVDWQDVDEQLARERESREVTNKLPPLDEDPSADQEQDQEDKNLVSALISGDDAAVEAALIADSSPTRVTRARRLLQLLGSPDVAS